MSIFLTSGAKLLNHYKGVDPVRDKPLQAAAAVPAERISNGVDTLFYSSIIHRGLTMSELFKTEYWKNNKNL